jgi:hypothetical protein
MTCHIAARRPLDAERHRYDGRQEVSFRREALTDDLRHKAARRRSRSEVSVSVARAGGGCLGWRGRDCESLTLCNGGRPTAGTQVQFCCDQRGLPKPFLLRIRIENIFSASQCGSADELGRAEKLSRPASRERTS